MTTDPFSFRDHGQQNSANVVAVKPGAVAEEIIIGAHYDSVNDGTGADDNASGAAVLLAVAAQLKNVETHYTIKMIAYGAEEASDMYGSIHAVSEMSTSERAATVAMVNLDSLASGDIDYVYGDATKLQTWTLDAARRSGSSLQTMPVSALQEDSDYFAYQEVGIPFIYFEATNWTLGDRDGSTRVDPRYGDKGEIIHTSYDKLPYLDATFPGRVDAKLKLYTAVLYLIATEYR